MRQARKTTNWLIGGPARGPMPFFLVAAGAERLALSSVAYGETGSWLGAQTIPPEEAAHVYVKVFAGAALF